eukprot:m.230961 g.230961  ORF g.230961 m.230961 type:complete len:54 (+) comp40063_c0_seq22:1929-2090(+)
MLTQKLLQMVNGRALVHLVAMIINHNILTKAVFYHCQMFYLKFFSNPIRFIEP